MKRLRLMSENFGAQVTANSSVGDEMVTNKLDFKVSEAARIGGAVEASPLGRAELRQGTDFCMRGLTFELTGILRQAGFGRE